MICNIRQSVVYFHFKACTLLLQDTWPGVETCVKVMYFWKFEFGRNKKGEVFGILSQVKELSKSNDVHEQKTFLSST